MPLLQDKTVALHFNGISVFEIRNQKWVPCCDKA